MKMKRVFLCVCILMITVAGGCPFLWAEDTSKDALEQRLKELSGRYSPLDRGPWDWGNHVYDKDFHQGDIYAVTAHAVVTYLYFIRRQIDKSYECFFINRNHEEVVAPALTFSNNAWERELEALDCSAASLDYYKPSVIYLKGKEPDDRIVFQLHNDGLYRSDNAPCWDEFVVKWAFKFCHTQQELSKELSAKLNRTWADVIGGKKLFGEKERSLTLEGLISYMRVAYNLPQHQTRLCYYFYYKTGGRYDNCINANERYLKHSRQDDIGEDDVLISQLKDNYLVVEQVGESYYLYERQEDGSYDMSKAPYWNEFMKVYGAASD